ncbi:alpha/beta fold hydrolase [Microbacterium gorillae]|uniref:alpha/beta fold hydrolase n=1 Tax=Microbacterium gorillae TaxID=1231063 RepID=UPI00058CCF10|nr:alpha/beta fold hydrolase [Microbacterium gorillae]
MSTTTTRRLQDLTVDDHIITVPLVWGDDADKRTIDVHAAVVTREGGEDLPYLTFLQGGPGIEAPTPFHQPTQPSWLDDALAHYRVVMLDQRGTGKSSPVSDGILDEMSATDVAEHLTHLRADSIVRDAEAMREHLGATTWSTLGQSFGGFTTLAYLTTDASSLDDVFITGGLSAVGRHPDDVYALCYDKMRVMTERYYRRFPEHRDAMRRLVDLAADGRIVLPSGEVVSVSRLRSTGSLLGSDNGWQQLWSVLDGDPLTNAFRYDLAGAMPFGGRNPLYYVFHESSYADGFATNWSAERTEPQDYRDDPTLFTGEHVRRDWTETVPAFQPWKDVVDELATVDWPQLYDAEKIAASGATGAAAIYVNDVYVPLEFSLETAELLPGVKTWVTSENEHGGLRTGRVLPRLIELAQDKRVR